LIPSSLRSHFSFLLFLPIVNRSIDFLMADDHNRPDGNFPVQNPFVPPANQDAPPIAPPLPQPPIATYQSLLRHIEQFQVGVAGPMLQLPHLTFIPHMIPNRLHVQPLAIVNAQVQQFYQQQQMQQLQQEHRQLQQQLLLYAQQQQLQQAVGLQPPDGVLPQHPNHQQGRPSVIVAPARESVIVSTQADNQQRRQSVIEQNRETVIVSPPPRDNNAAQVAPNNQVQQAVVQSPPLDQIPLLQRDLNYQELRCQQDSTNRNEASSSLKRDNEEISGSDRESKNVKNKKQEYEIVDLTGDSP
ncbi:hypothetical protein PFISCL1PPCAC_14460, partial [Pristionchus fissidentatus]